MHFFRASVLEGWQGSPKIESSVPGAGHQYQWRYLNNVVADAGVGFSSAYECLGAEGALCRKPEQVANNVFLRSKFAHHDGWDGGSVQHPISHAGNDWHNNVYCIIPNKSPPFFRPFLELAKIL